MIPKVIHYCWFGGRPKPDAFKQCLESWKLYCPDFKIIEWNETNTKHYQNKFFKDALRKKKYAFVSDYIRVKVLYEFGGIYLDTDMLLLKPINTLLNYNFFSGFEVENRVAYGLFGGVKGHRFIFEMLDYYVKTEFDEFNPPIITHAFKNVINSTSLKENEILFKPDCFYPLTFQNREKDYTLFITEETYAVHLWNHSWKVENNENIFYLLKKIKIVLIDFIFYGYSLKYLKRYLKEFLRKIYLGLKSRFK
jgi:mannosyltransferase OCH1-like enzyme